MRFSPRAPLYRISTKPRQKTLRGGRNCGNKLVSGRSLARYGLAKCCNPLFKSVPSRSLIVRVTAALLQRRQRSVLAFSAVVAFKSRLASFNLSARSCSGSALACLRILAFARHTPLRLGGEPLLRRHNNVEEGCALLPTGWLQRKARRNIAEKWLSNGVQATARLESTDSFEPYKWMQRR